MNAQEKAEQKPSAALREFTYKAEEMWGYLNGVTGLNNLPKPAILAEFDSALAALREEYDL